ncbi:hypothetical protein BDA99DRAFT_530510 [Phascolomyces articulosus]|uniref:RRM domain-containing protein n=1 Tax=Phascolomyces articulosus TaxID=60185 RepID=A0AAD5JWS5_9FUNG|nr:hypothetical protein BDA99DRAFT_530510 [Phascolomyces articulosus]
MSNNNESAGAATETGSDPSTIYVGNLDQRVTDTMLHDLFATLGSVNNVKIVSIRRHGPYPNVNYGFVEFDNKQTAEQALRDMNGRKFFNHEIKLNWAQQNAQQQSQQQQSQPRQPQPQQQQGGEDTSDHFHVFVGDLARDINDEMLSKAFANFGTMSEAHVMWDAASGNSRGYGFVAFRDKTDAEQAIATMNGEWLGSRMIRCNWATQKGQMATPPAQPGQQLPYEIVINQTPSSVTNVYVGNLPPDTAENDITQPFQQVGTVQEVRLQAERGYAFVRMDTHENAAKAIVQLQNVNINGRTAKLSWGRDRGQQQQGNNYHWGNNDNHHSHGHHLYAGRAGHNTRGFSYQGHHGNNKSNISENVFTDSPAPSSLASLDPHASGTQATTASTIPPTMANQWNNQQSSSQ